MKTNILKTEGTPYENGKKSGKYFKEIIQNSIDKYKIALKDIEIKNKCKNIQIKLKKDFPEYYEEVKGKADGAEVEFDVYFAMMCPEILNIDKHCTTIICKKENGKYIISHNEDDNYTKESFNISKIITKDGWLATNDIYNMPFGNGFSWNSFGIVKTINYCHEPNICLENIPGYFSQRHISDATSIKDLIKRCNEIRPASGYHINALDINNNIAVSIEVYPDNIDVKYIDDYYIHSNHYIHNEYKNRPKTDIGSNSIFRLNKAHELFNKIEKRNIYNIRKVLEYRDINNTFEKSIFQNEKDPYITGMNFSFDIDNNEEIELSVYVNNEILKLPYDLNN